MRDKIQRFLLMIAPAVLTLAIVVTYRVGYRIGHDAALREVIHALHERGLLDDAFWAKSGKP